MPYDHQYNPSFPPPSLPTSLPPSTLPPIHQSIHLYYSRIHWSISSSIYPSIHSFFLFVLQGLSERTKKQEQSRIQSELRQRAQKRLRMAQSIQRELEEVEVKQAELEKEGVVVEKALRTGTSKSHSCEVLLFCYLSLLYDLLPPFIFRNTSPTLVRFTHLWPCKLGESRDTISPRVHALFSL